MDDDVARLEELIDRFTPGVAGEARAALSRMRSVLPGAFELAYDNYNALAIGFSPTEKASSAALSIVLYPRWVSLCFLYGARLDDPHGLLRGAGRQVRHIRLDGEGMLDDPRLLALVGQAVAAKGRPLDVNAGRRVMIQSVAKRQLPRRP
jgi:hypothetical protein